MNKKEFSEFLYKGLMPRHLVISYRELEYFINQKLEKFELHRVEALYLILLHFNEGKNQKEISEMMKTDNTLTSKILKKLESKKLVRKEKDSYDKREKNIYLSDKGEKLIPKLLKVYEEIGSTALNGIEMDDYLTALRTLDQVIDNLHTENEKIKK